MGTIILRGFLPVTINLLQKSQAFDTTWTTNNVTVTPNTTAAPDLTTTADTITATGTVSALVQQPFTTINGQPYTVSVHAKAGIANTVQTEIDGAAGGVIVNFNLSTQTIGTPQGFGTGSASTHTVPPTLTALANGWFRCTITTTLDTTTAATVFYVQNNGGAPAISDTIFLWGAQAEIGTIATGYVAT